MNQITSNPQTDIKQSPGFEGIYLMMLGTLAFSGLNGIIKYLNHIDAYQLVFFRGLTSLCLCLLYLMIKGIPLLGTNRKLLVTRGLIGTISMTLFFLAIKHIPLGSAVTLRYLAPVFAALLALFFLGEKVRKIQWFFFAIAFLGAALLKGFDFRVSTIGFTLILGSAIFSGIVYAVIKKIGKTEHPIVIVGYFMFVATFTGLTLSLPNWQMPDPSDWIFLLSIGIFGFFGQLCMTMAIQRDILTRVIPFKYLEALLSVLIGLIWFGEGFSTLAAVGIALIVMGMVANTFIAK